MPAAIRKESTNPQRPGTIIALTPKASRRFYEPLVLFKALYEASNAAATGNAEDPASRFSASTDKVAMSPEDRFRRFVCKLATVCDRRKGGETVTACSVLEGPSGITYVFGCNNVDEAQLGETRDFLKKLLFILAALSPDVDAKVASRQRSVLLMLIVDFNTPRIEQYARFLEEYLGKCIRFAGPGMAAQDSGMVHELARLRDDIPTALLDDSDTKKAQSSYRLIRRLNLFVSSPQPQGPWSKILDLAKPAGEAFTSRPSVQCWAELSHAISRLLAYKQAAHVFRDTRAEWPDLFVRDLAVVAVPSSPAESSQILGEKSKNAEAIVGRMRSDKDDIEDLRAAADHLQKYDLDGRITRLVSQRLRPVVHAEVLVLDWILCNKEYRFFRSVSPPSQSARFGSQRYIGSSKPTCRLCRLYFDLHNSRVAVRPGHGNLYLTWRLPDVVSVDTSAIRNKDEVQRREKATEKAVAKRQQMLNSMVQEFRREAVRIVDEKRTVGKAHDSNTYTNLTARLTATTNSSAWWADGVEEADVDALATRFGLGVRL